MHSKFLLVILPISVLLLWTNCKHTAEFSEPLPDGATKIAPSEQRIGNADSGRVYSHNGDYLNSGIPLTVFKLVFSANSADDLARTGDNKGIPFNYTVTTASNGVKVVYTNCMSCHRRAARGAYPDSFIVPLYGPAANVSAGDSVIFDVRLGAGTQRVPTVKTDFLWSVAIRATAPAPMKVLKPSAPATNVSHSP